MMELPMMLAGMMQRFSVELVPGLTIEPCAGMTMRPSGEIRVKLTARESRPLSDASKPSSWAYSQPLGA
jgi:hypothetical protein